MNETIAEDKEEEYPQKKYTLDIIKVILMGILILLLLYAIYIYKEDSLNCVLDPVQYYEQMFNQSCFCSGNKGVRGLNLTDIK